MIIRDVLDDEQPAKALVFSHGICSKLVFRTEQKALAFRIHVRKTRQKDQRQYYCKKCVGWHLTSRLYFWQLGLVK